MQSHPHREFKKFFEWNPSKSLIASFRQIQKLQHSMPLFGGAKLVWVKSKYRFWSAVTGADIHLNASIGDGFVMPHPNGVVIHRKAVIGCNCMLMQQVTIGQTANDNDVPVLGDDVYVGAGAKIIGKVVIGNGASIGANAVVLISVPENMTAVGVPAKLICRVDKY
jgi:serine O-acetyltransferase